MMLKIDARRRSSPTPLFDSKAIDSSATCRTRSSPQAWREHTPLGIGKAMTEFLAQVAAAIAERASADDGSTPP